MASTDGGSCPREAPPSRFAQFRKSYLRSVGMQQGHTLNKADMNTPMRRARNAACAILASLAAIGFVLFLVFSVKDDTAKANQRISLVGSNVYTHRTWPIYRFAVQHMYDNMHVGVLFACCSFLLAIFICAYLFVYEVPNLIFNLPLIGGWITPHYVSRLHSYILFPLIIVGALVLLGFNDVIFIVTTYALLNALMFIPVFVDYLKHDVIDLRKSAESTPSQKVSVDEIMRYCVATQFVTSAMEAVGLLSLTVIIAMAVGLIGFNAGSNASSVPWEYHVIATLVCVWLNIKWILDIVRQTKFCKCDLKSVTDLKHATPYQRFVYILHAETPRYYAFALMLYAISVFGMIMLNRVDFAHQELALDALYSNTGV